MRLVSFRIGSAEGEGGHSALANVELEPFLAAGVLSGLLDRILHPGCRQDERVESGIAVRQHLVVRACGTCAVIEEGSPPRMWLLIACTSCSRLDELGYWSLRQRSGFPRQPGYRASARFRLAGSRVQRWR